MNRRTVLTLSATTTFAALAGCTSPGRYRLGLQEQDPDELPNIIVTALPEHTRVDISSDTQSDEVPITLVDITKPVDGGVVYGDETYYDLSYNQREQASDYVSLSVDATKVENPDEDIDFAQLPTQDQTVVEYVIQLGGPSQPAVYTEDELDSSVIAEGLANSGSEQETVITYEGQHWTVMSTTSERQLHVYEYTGEVIGSSEEELVDWIQSELIFTLSDLTDDQQEVIEQAINGKYESSDEEEAYADIATVFHNHRPIETATDTGGDWLVEYNSQLYEASLSHPAGTIDRSEGTEEA